MPSSSSSFIISLFWSHKKGQLREARFASGRQNTGSKGEGAALKTTGFFYLSTCAILLSFPKDCKETSSWQQPNPPHAVTGYHKYVSHFGLLYWTYQPAVEFLLVCSVSFAISKTTASNYSLQRYYAFEQFHFRYVAVYWEQKWYVKPTWGEITVGSRST